MVYNYEKKDTNDSMIMYNGKNVTVTEPVVTSAMRPVITGAMTINGSSQVDYHHAMKNRTYKRSDSILETPAG